MRKGFIWAHTLLERHPKHILTSLLCCDATRMGQGRAAGSVGGLGNLDRKASSIVPSSSSQEPSTSSQASNLRIMGKDQRFTRCVDKGQKVAGP